MSTLDRAISIASNAHKDQVDKAGSPYILHPLRVMFQVASVEEQIVAVLHDTLEDSSVTLDDLRQEGFSTHILEALTCLTKIPGESYDQFISRVMPNSLARQVKIADIQDNMNLSRLPAIADKDLERLRKYHRALKTLIGAAGRIT